MFSLYSLCLCAFALLVVGVNGGGRRFLFIPNNATHCSNRPKHWQWSPSGGNQHYYFYSNDVKEYKGKKYDWLDARNLCRQYCMDAVSVETFRENQMLYNFIEQRGVGTGLQFSPDLSVTRWRSDKKCGPNYPMEDTGLPAMCDPNSEYHCCNGEGECKSNEYYWDCGCLDCIDYKESINYFWTSGRLCDFKGCENRTDLVPLIVKGWFWSGSNAGIPPTNVTPHHWDYQPWSHTGHTGDPQPDNAELDVNGTPESCVAISKNLYKDGIQWHDIGCYHQKPVLCEDSDELLAHLKIQ